MEDLNVISTEIKQIKRFLKGISETTKESKSNNSSYYSIVRNGNKFNIRFSDHFKNEFTSDIEIILTYSNVLIIRTVFGYSLTDYYNINYIKSFFFLLPSIYATNKILVTSVKKQAREIDKRNSEITRQNNKINKYEKLSDIKEAISLLEKNEIYKNKIKQLEGVLTAKNKHK